MEVKNLAKWEDQLNTCIRCGYCYENCHIFKFSNWESDSPRGKLVLAHGLLTEALHLTEETAEKFFQCFYCGLCEENCSSNVAVREIITGVRQVIADIGVDVEGTTSYVDENWCSGCGICASICKAEAISLEEKARRVVRIDKVKCEGCGVCIAGCPAGAMELQLSYGVSEKALLNEVIDFLENNESTIQSPKIIGFCCDWSVHPGLKLSNWSTKKDSPFKVMVSMCTGRVSSTLILEAFKRGVSGVLLSACSLGKCEHDGNYKTLTRVLLLKKLLSQLNIEPERLRIEWINTGQAEEFQTAMEEFYQDIKKLGPLN